MNGDWFVSVVIDNPWDLALIVGFSSDVRQMKAISIYSRSFMPSRLVSRHRITNITSTRWGRPMMTAKCVIGKNVIDTRDHVTLQATLNLSRDGNRLFHNRWRLRLSQQMATSIFAIKGALDLQNRRWPRPSQQMATSTFRTDDALILKTALLTVISVRISSEPCILSLEFAIVI